MPLSLAARLAKPYSSWLIRPSIVTERALDDQRQGNNKKLVDTGIRSIYRPRIVIQPFDIHVSLHVICTIYNSVTKIALRRSKQYKLENVAIARRLTYAAVKLSALISSPVPSSKSLSLSVAVLELFTAYTLRYAVTLNFDPVTLTFDL